MISSFIQYNSNLTSQRNYRVTLDGTTIEYKLHKQFLIAQLHKNDTSAIRSSTFAYSPLKKSSTDRPCTPEIHTIQNLRVSRDLSCAVEVVQYVGKKPTQEDTFIASSFEILDPQGQKHTAVLTGVFDGHGGSETSVFMKDNLQDKLESTFAALFSKTLKRDHPLKALENEQSLSDKVMWNVLKITPVELHDAHTDYFAGTTASFSLLIDGKDLWHANVGDSRSIITSSEKTIQLSEDMEVRFNFPQGSTEGQFKKIEYEKLEDPCSEYADAYPLKNDFERSIWKRGGFCANRPDTTTPNFNGRLAMARAIGDKHLKNGLCQRPKIVKIRLDEQFPNSDSCLLLHASDGLWDIAATNKVADGINSDKDSSLAEIALNLARSAIEYDDFDNTSVVLTKIDLRALRGK